MHVKRPSFGLAHLMSRPRNLRIGRGCVCTLRRYLAILLVAHGACAATAASDNGVKSFDIPAGEAVQTLKRAAQQGGLQIVFLADTVRDVRTPAVQGEFRPRDVLDRMLAHTGLMVVRDEKTGALIIEPRSRSNASPGAKSAANPGNQTMTMNKKLPARILGALTGALVPAADAAQPDETVTLSPFEVRSENLEGYRAGTATSATRVRMDIARVPASITVVTSELIRDAGIEKLDEVLRYTPGAGATDDVRGGGSSINLRGFVVNQTQFNGFTMDGNAAQINSPKFADRIEIAKGPSSLLYGQIKPGGVFNVLPKQAAFTDRGEVEAGIGSRHYRDATLDVNRELVRGKLAARFYSFYQDQDFKADFATREQYAFMPSIKWRPVPKLELTFLGLNYHKNENPIPGRPSSNVTGSLDSRGFPADWTVTTPSNSRVGALTVPAEVTNLQGERVATGTTGRTQAGARFDTYDLRWGPALSENGPDSLRAVESTLATFEALAYFSEHVVSRSVLFHNDSSRELNAIQRGNGVFGTGTGDFISALGTLDDFDETAFRQELLLTFPFLKAGKANVLLGYERRDIDSAEQSWEERNFIRLLPADRPTYANPHIDAALLRFPRGESGVRNHPELFNPATSISGAVTTDKRDGMYGTVQLDLFHERLFLLGGLRHDKADQRSRDPRVANPAFGPPLTFSDTVAQFGVSYRVLPDVTAFFSWSESSLPNGFDDDGAPLKPETGEGWEFGLKFNKLIGGRVNGSATWFDMRRNNIRRQELIYDLDGTLIASRYRTSGLEGSRGVELEFNARLTPNWSLLVGGAWLDTEILVDPEDPEHEGLPTRGAPEWSGFLMANYSFGRDHPLQGLTVGAGANYQDATRTADQLIQFLRVTESVTLVDVFASYRIRKFKVPVIVRLNMSNAFDAIKLSRDKNWTEPREFRCHVTVPF